MKNKIVKQLMEFYYYEMKGDRKYHVIRGILKTWEPILMMSNRRIYKKKINLPFKFVALMLARECHANCIFCPVPRKKDLVNKQSYMSMEVVKKVADELARHEFSGEINFGENGDALLNPYFRDIIKYAYEKLPLAKLMLYTNMMHLDKSLSEFLIKHNLSRLILNIDGASELTYGFSKPGLNFDKVKTNLHDFIDIRDKSGSDCRIRIEILPSRRYVELRKNRKQIDLPYDAPEVIKYWKTYLSQKDSIDEIVWFYNWGNRSNIIRRRSCPSGILGEAFFDKIFISTEGDAYICCLDYNTRLAYGNVLEDSIYDLWKTEKRRQVINDIINRRFRKIGEPCIHCNEKFDYLACYYNFVKHRYMAKEYSLDRHNKA